MSTRSTITIINPDKTAEQSFAHWDGYPSFMGTMLQMCYNTPYKAWHLIKNGAIDHVGFTDRPANLYKDGINDNNEFDEIYNPFDGKANNDYQNIVTNYTFYYNRDCHQDYSGNRPQHYNAKEVQTSWKYAEKYNYRSIRNLASLHVNASILPSEEYNYVYDASSAKPQWYVVYTALVNSKPIYNKQHVQIGDKGGTFVSKFRPLSNVLKSLDKDKDANGQIKAIRKNHLKFKRHQYNPTYQQFCHDMHQKYDRPAHQGVAKHSHTQNIVHGQTSLF